MLGHKPGDVLEKLQTEGIQIRFLRIGFVDAFLQLVQILVDIPVEFVPV